MRPGSRRAHTRSRQRQAAWRSCSEASTPSARRPGAPRPPGARLCPAAHRSADAHSSGCSPGLSTRARSSSILNQFLFPAPKSSYSWSSFPGELVCVVGREGNIVPCVLMPGVRAEPTSQDCEPASCLVIYCHANGEDLGVLNDAGHWLCDTLSVHMLIPEYPGYGVAPGLPHEASVTRNIETAYDFAVNALHWEPSQIIFFGRSIGTGPAVKLAAELPCGGLILVSPYTSVKDMVRTHAGIVTSWLTAELSNMFPSEQTMADVKCPALVVHGAQDVVIPPDQARRLHAACKSDDKRLVLLEGIGHHGIDLHLAVAHESPHFFNLAGYPKALNLDQFLCDPMLQGGTVAASVPAFDLRSMSWSRPTLPLGSAPQLHNQRATHDQSLLADTSSFWSFESQGRRQVITDEVLLSRIQREGPEMEADFFHADRLEKLGAKDQHGGDSSFKRHIFANTRFYHSSGITAPAAVAEDGSTQLVGGATREALEAETLKTGPKDSSEESAASTERAADAGSLSWRTDPSGNDNPVVGEQLSNSLHEKLFVY